MSKNECIPGIGCLSSHIRQPSSYGCLHLRDTAIRLSMSSRSAGKLKKKIASMKIQKLNAKDLDMKRNECHHHKSFMNLGTTCSPPPFQARLKLAPELKLRGRNTCSQMVKEQHQSTRAYGVCDR